MPSKFTFEGRRRDGFVPSPLGKREWSGFVGDGKGEDALKPFWRRVRGSGAKVEAEAEQFLDEWLAEAKASDIRLIVGMALTLERHRQGLLNYYLYPIPTGP